MFRSCENEMPEGACMQDWYDHKQSDTLFLKAWVRLSTKLRADVYRTKRFCYFFYFSSIIDLKREAYEVLKVFLPSHTINK